MQNLTVLDSDGPVKLELPEQWLWDIIDEFIYQYQVFCTWRSKVKSKTDEELVMLAEGGPVCVKLCHIPDG
jgi:translation initiation factor 3 subunit L